LPSPGWTGPKIADESHQSLRLLFVSKPEVRDISLEDYADALRFCRVTRQLRSDGQKTIDIAAQPVAESEKPVGPLIKGS
jgi:hypothetical protein